MGTSCKTHRFGAGHGARGGGIPTWPRGGFSHEPSGMPVKIQGSTCNIFLKSASAAEARGQDVSRGKCYQIP